MPLAAPFSQLFAEASVSFGAVDYLHGLWGVLFLGILILWSRRRAKKDLGRLFGRHFSERMAPDTLWRRRAWRSTFVLLGLASVVFAMAQPRLGYVWEEKAAMGLEVVVALDVSRSMNAQDVAPNRLERARRDVFDLVDALPGSRVGLVLFAGGAYPRMPQTLDHHALKDILKRSSTETIRAQGSSVASAIGVSLDLMDLESPADRAIVLVSDGENWDDRIEAPLRIAKDAGVRIYTLGVGGLKGSPIPKKKGGFKTDREGKMVISRLEESVLKRVAEMTEGAYVQSTGGASDARQLVAALNSQLSKSDQGSSRDKNWKERFQWPLGLGFVLLFGAFAQSERRDQRGLLSFLLVLGILFPLSPSTSFASETELNVMSPRALWSLALEKSENGAHYEAYRAFSQASDQAVEPELRWGARYNAANAAYAAGNLEEAVAEWQRVVENASELPGLEGLVQSAQRNSDAVRQEIQKRLEIKPPEEQEQDSESSEEKDEQTDENEEDSSESESADESEEEPQDESNNADAQEEDSSDAVNEENSGEPEEQPLAEGVQEMSEEEARRLLEAVEEGQPEFQVGGRSAEKDW